MIVSVVTGLLLWLQESLQVEKELQYSGNVFVGHWHSRPEYSTKILKQMKKRHTNFEVL